MEVVAALLEPRDAESLGWVVGPDYTVSDRILRQAHAVLDRQVPRRVISFRHHRLSVRKVELDLDTT